MDDVFLGSLALMNVIISLMPSPPPFTLVHSCLMRNKLPYRAFHPLRRQSQFFTLSNTPVHASDVLRLGWAFSDPLLVDINQHADCRFLAGWNKPTHDLRIGIPFVVAAIPLCTGPNSPVSILTLLSLLGRSLSGTFQSLQ